MANPPLATPPSPIPLFHTLTHSGASEARLFTNGRICNVESEGVENEAEAKRGRGARESLPHVGIGGASSAPWRPTL